MTIIKFEPKIKSSEEKLEFKLSTRYVKGKCLYHTYVVDRNTRVVSCDVCNTKFDPIECLTALARQWDVYKRDLKNIKEEVSKREQELQSILNDIKNAKNRLKTIMKK